MVLICCLVYIYIYIYIYRERERERETVVKEKMFTKLYRVATNFSLQQPTHKEPKSFLAFPTFEVLLTRKVFTFHAV
jgi:hypothetical protein